MSNVAVIIDTFGEKKNTENANQVQRDLYNDRSEQVAILPDVRDQQDVSFSLHRWILVGMRSRLECAMRRNIEERQIPDGRFLDGRDRFGVSGRRGPRHARRAPAGRQDRPEVDDDGLDSGFYWRLGPTDLRGLVGAALRHRQDRDWRLRRHVLRPGAHVFRRDLGETDQRYIRQLNGRSEKEPMILHKCIII